MSARLALDVNGRGVKFGKYGKLGTAGILALAIGCYPDNDPPLVSTVGSGSPASAAASSTTGATAETNDSDATAGSTGPGPAPGCSSGGIFVESSKGLPELCPDGQWECCLPHEQCCCEHGVWCEGYCSIWTQECPADEKCMPYAATGGSWNAMGCAPLDPNAKQPGDPCTAPGGGLSGVDDCALGSMCWGVDAETDEGICVAFCLGTEMNPTCSELDAECLIANGGVLALCLPTCDPLIQDCGGTDLCTPNPSGESFVCVLDASGSGGFLGDDCQYVNGCDPGLHCAAASNVAGCQTDSCCTLYCDLTDAEPALICSGVDQGEVCTPWYPEGEAPPGLEHVGACALP